MTSKQANLVNVAVNVVRCQDTFFYFNKVNVSHAKLSTFYDIFEGLDNSSALFKFDGRLGIF